VGSSGAHILDSLTFPGARRRVWIRAGNDDGFGPWGPATDFILPGTPEDTPVLNVTRNSFYGGAAPPEVTAPIQNEAPTRPEITWSAGVPGVPYQLWVQNENGVLINQSAITGTSFTPDNDLADGVYSAWVRQLPANGQPLPWSSRYQFAVGQSSLPEVPVLGFTPNLNGTNCSSPSPGPEMLCSARTTSPQRTSRRRPCRTSAKAVGIGHGCGRSGPTVKKVSGANSFRSASTATPVKCFWTDAKIAEAEDCRTSTVERVRRGFVEVGFENALHGNKRARPAVFQNGPFGV
jgi:hypothetical protein